VHRTGELSGQYKTLEQQRETASLGMWVFLSTEVLFFGGLFMTYTINRSTYPDIFSAASKTITLWLGAVNTVVLIASSLTMALSVWASQAGKKKLLTIFPHLHAHPWLRLSRHQGHRVPRQIRRAPHPRLEFQSRTWRRRRHQRPRPAFLLALFRHDRLARPAHDRRRRPATLAH